MLFTSAVEVVNRVAALGQTCTIMEHLDGFTVKYDHQYFTNYSRINNVLLSLEAAKKEQELTTV